jgi:hypothetical protein
MNTDNGAVITTFPIGAGTNFARFDPKRELAFTSNRDGTLSSLRNCRQVRGSVSDPNGIGLAHDGIRFRERTDLSRHGGHDRQQDSGANDLRHRYCIAPGSVRLLFLDSGA